MTLLNRITASKTHVVYVRDAAGTVNFYLNGVAVVTNTIAGNISPAWGNTYRFGLENSIDRHFR